MTPTIIGIDPGTRQMGIVVLRERELLDFGVYTLRNGERPHDVIGQAKGYLLRHIAIHGPAVVAIEKPIPMATRRAALLSVIGQELHERSRELNLTVVELTPEQVRAVVAGNPKARKLEVAEAIVAQGFDVLQRYLPKRPARSALGYRPRDRYWLHMFDALAVAIAASRQTTPSAEVRIGAEKGGTPVLA